MIRPNARLRLTQYDLSAEELQTIATAFKNPDLLASPKLLAWRNIFRRTISLNMET